MDRGEVGVGPARPAMGRGDRRAVGDGPAAGLGSLRLTYHEAHVAQAAREMIAAGDWLVPILDGRPWLEKPPWSTGSSSRWPARPAT